MLRQLLVAKAEQETVTVEGETALHLAAEKLGGGGIGRLLESLGWVWGGVWAAVKVWGGWATL